MIESLRQGMPDITGSNYLGISGCFSIFLVVQFFKFPFIVKRVVFFIEFRYLAIKSFSYKSIFTRLNLQTEKRTPNKVIKLRLRKLRGFLKQFFVHYNLTISFVHTYSRSFTCLIVLLNSLISN